VPSEFALVVASEPDSASGHQIRTRPATGLSPRREPAPAIPSAGQKRQSGSLVQEFELSWILSCPMEVVTIHDDSRGRGSARQDKRRPARNCSRLSLTRLAHIKPGQDWRDLPRPVAEAQAADGYSAVSGRVPLSNLYERGRSPGVGVQVSAQSWQGVSRVFHLGGEFGGL